MQKNKTILVIEDEKSLLHVIKDRLEAAGYTICFTKTGEGALLKLYEEHVDLIWLDHYLPGDMTGMDFLARLRADPKIKNIPVFVISNAGWDDRILSYKEVGITKYYVKSDMTLDQIVDDINECLKINIKAPEKL